MSDSDTADRMQIDGTEREQVTNCKYKQLQWKPEQDKNIKADGTEWEQVTNCKYKQLHWKPEQDENKSKMERFWKALGKLSEQPSQESKNKSSTCVSEQQRHTDAKHGL